MYMKIDTHQHYWAYAAADFPWISADMPTLQQDCAPADVAPALQVAGVDAVLAVQARSCAAETDYLLGLARTNPKIVGVVGWTDLCAAKVHETLDTYAGQPRLKGFRHILQDEPELSSLICNPDFNRGLKALQARRLVYDVLVFEHQIMAVVDFCARHDAHWLVLDHVGKPGIRDWPRSQRPSLYQGTLLGGSANSGMQAGDRSNTSSRWQASLRALAGMPHVVCKLSGLVTETDWASGAGLSPDDSETILACFDRALELFGPDRILYGSDWPVCQLAAPYAVVHGLAQRWANSRLTRDEQHAFWCGNAQRCYNLEPTPANP
jgi:L-fuconolactonase